MKNRTIRIALAFGLALSGLSLATPVPWGSEGHWYEAVYDSAGFTWEDARALAENAGGYLASSNSDAENSFLFSLVSDPKYWYLAPPPYEYSLGPWLGAYQYDKNAEPDGHWRWTGDEPWGYSFWAVGEPNDLGNFEDWAQFYTNYDMGVLTPGPTWNDTADYNPEKGFIIEWDQDPSPVELSTWSRIKPSFP